MAWDFSTEPDFEDKLTWMRSFVRDEVEPLDLMAPAQAFLPLDDELRPVVDPLKEQVRDRQLWACHLGPELGGQGYGQVKLALMNEILGRAPTWAPVIFGCNAPDTGNAEILAHYGSPDQKDRYLEPLLGGEVFSCFSMTEPHAGADPLLFTTSARRDGDDWVIDGRKFFSSHARQAAFVIVLAVTDPSADPYRRLSMFLVETDTPGLVIERNIGLGDEPLNDGYHALITYDAVRVPAANLLGEPGDGFLIAQTRLSGGRVHHAMRTVGECQRAFDMMCERALSRRVRGDKPLASLSTVQDHIAEAYAAIEQFRLYVLYTAWQLDQTHDYESVRKDIASIKALTPKVLLEVIPRAIQVHGALGVSNELPLHRMFQGIPLAGLQDGPTEVHRTTVARQVLRRYEAAPGEWPTEHIPTRLAAYAERYPDLVEHLVGQW
jgi:acyl-CoA dehydrogenase